jgi:hypothetical protein
MQLPPEQTERFYRIWLALLHYVNKERQLVPTFSSVAEEAAIPTSDALQLRDALWADDPLLESFIATNPAKLLPADLVLVGSWRYRLAGNFFVLRHLKKYSLFLSEGSSHIYGVLGLVSPIEEVVGFTVPVYVQAVLLPFEDKIIYDSLLMPYRITFGSGIRGRLNETYRNVQEREGVTTTLLPAETSTSELRNAVLASNSKILGTFRKDLARRGLSQNMVEQHAGNIEAFAQSYLLEQEPARRLLDMTSEDVQAYLRAAGNKTTTTSFKRFVRFLADTGRMDYEQAEPLQDFLKRARE